MKHCLITEFGRDSRNPSCHSMRLSENAQQSVKSPCTRHRAATSILQTGAFLRSDRVWLGHSHLPTTTVNMHLVEKRLQSIAHLAEWAAGEQTGAGRCPWSRKPRNLSVKACTGCCLASCGLLGGTSRVLDYGFPPWHRPARREVAMATCCQAHSLLQTDRDPKPSCRGGRVWEQVHRQAFVELKR